MDVKHAVALSKQHIVELFGEEQPTNVGLEEVEFNETSKDWIVTVGFSRPWDEPKNALAVLTGTANYPRRVFKIVRVSDATGKVVSVKAREVKAAA